MAKDLKKKRALQKTFLDEYAKTLHIGKSCLAAGIHRDHWRRWIEVDEWFIKEVAQIEDSFCDEMEEKLRERVRGQNKDSWGDWTVTKYYLEQRYPQRWAPKSEIAFVQNGPMQVKIIEEEPPAASAKS